MKYTHILDDDNEITYRVSYWIGRQDPNDHACYNDAPEFEMQVYCPTTGEDIAEQLPYELWTKIKDFCFIDYEKNKYAY